jgi:transcriptional regulator with XRE-family HTH domain
LNLCDRLKEERERLGFTQPVFAAQAETKKGSIINWEKGASSPTAVQLEALSKIGVDVQYVVTGQRSEAALSPELSGLIALYQKAPWAVKAAVLRALSGDVSESVGVNVRGSNNQIAGRDFNGSK